MDANIPIFVPCPCRQQTKETGLYRLVTHEIISFLWRESANAETLDDLSCGTVRYRAFLFLDLTQSMRTRILPVLVFVDLCISRYDQRAEALGSKGMIQTDNM